MAHLPITPEVETPSWFPTEVRTALDVCFRGRLLNGSNPFPSLFEQINPTIAPLEKPTGIELTAAEEVLEEYVHSFLAARVGERLEQAVAVDVFRALRAVGTSTRKPRLSVCVGDIMRKVDVGDGRGAQWVTLDGKDGCGLVFHGRSSRCEDCQRTQTTRRKRQLAGWRQNVRGFLEYPVYFPDGTTGILRAGACLKCGAEFQITDLRRTRCERCRTNHR